MKNILKHLKLKFNILFFRVVYIGNHNDNWHLKWSSCWVTSEAESIFSLAYWSGKKKPMSPLKEWFHSQANSSKVQGKYPVFIAVVPWPCMNWCWWHSHVAAMPQWLKLLWGSVQRTLRRQNGQDRVLTLQDKYFIGICSVKCTTNVGHCGVG